MDLDIKKVQNASEALLAYIKQKEADVLLDDRVRVQLQFGFKKVPDVTDKIVKVRLPHPLKTSTTSICLFVKDLTKRGSDTEETKSHFEELLQEKDIKGIEEVLPLKTLKTDYIPYEAKKNLSEMYDVYLADSRIVHLLPAFLGKAFFGRKRYPIPVNMEAVDLKQEFAKVLSISQCVVSGRGSSCQMPVGHSAQPVDSIVENIRASVNKVKQSLPGEGDNFKSIHINTKSSPSLLIYLSEGSANDVKLPPPAAPLPLDPAEDVTTVMGGKVRVLPDGTVQILNKKTKKLYNARGELRNAARKRMEKQKKKPADLQKRNRKKKSFAKKKAEKMVPGAGKESKDASPGGKHKRKAEDDGKVQQEVTVTPPSKKPKKGGDNTEKVKVEENDGGTTPPAKKMKKVTETETPPTKKMEKVAENNDVVEGEKSKKSKRKSLESSPVLKKIKIAKEDVWFTPPESVKSPKKGKKGKDVVSSPQFSEVKPENEKENVSKSKKEKNTTPNAKKNTTPNAKKNTTPNAKKNTTPNAKQNTTPNAKQNTTPNAKKNKVNGENIESPQVKSLKSVNESESAKKKEKRSRDSLGTPVMKKSENEARGSVKKDKKKRESLSTPVKIVADSPKVGSSEKRKTRKSVGTPKVK